MQFSPAVADGKVLVGSHDGALYALDAQSGRLVWRYQTGDGVQASPAAAQGRVFVGSFDGKVYAFGNRLSVNETTASAVSPNQPSGEQGKGQSTGATGYETSVGFALVGLAVAVAANFPVRKKKLQNIDRSREEGRGSLLSFSHSSTPITEIASHTTRRDGNSLGRAFIGSRLLLHR